MKERIDEVNSRLTTEDRQELPCPIYQSMMRKKEVIMSIELKIKAMHLGAESRIIRAQEERLKRKIRKAKERGRKTSGDEQARERIHQHRKWDVRREARATHLARAYLKGTPYKVVESGVQECKEWELRYILAPKIAAMVMKYSSPRRLTVDTDIMAWVNGEAAGDETSIKAA